MTKHPQEIIDLHLANIDTWAYECIMDAVINIKERKLLRDQGSKTYNIANWKDDWNWIMDDESNFEQVCAYAQLNPYTIQNEVMRLSGTRLVDGVEKTVEWFKADTGK